MTDHQLRKALSAANDLEPPTDELFAQRALQRGRARAARRRNAIVGAAAGLALVVLGGGTWLVGQSVQGGVSTSAGSAERMVDSGSPALGTAAAGGADEAPTVTGVSPARDESVWLAGAVTPQRSAFDALVPTLTTAYPDVFGGAYATDESNTHIVVTLTRREAALERLVTASMPSPQDVRFAVVTNTAVSKLKVAAQVRADARGWMGKGLPIADVRLDARADRVVVTVLSGNAVRVVEDHYGPGIVRAEVGTGAPLGVPPTGATLPTPQQ